MQQMPTSSKTLRRRLAGLLTEAMVLSARIDAQEQAERDGGPVEIAIGVATPPEVREIQRFITSAAYSFALESYVDGNTPLAELARALEPLKPMLPWLAGPAAKQENSVNRQAKIQSG